MESIVSAVNDVVWSPALVYLCLGAGLFLSLRGGFLQLRHLRHMWQLLFQPKDNVTGVSSFQALSMTLAGRVGTGNIAGVATAITFGGPGAVFWMWMVAFLGASSAFVESTLGQIYKEKINGEYRGGPAFYIEKGLGIKWFAWLFAIVTIFSCGLFLPGYIAFCSRIGAFSERLQRMAQAFSEGLTECGASSPAENTAEAPLAQISGFVSMMVRASGYARILTDAEAREFSEATLASGKCSAHPFPVTLADLVAMCPTAHVDAESRE